MAVSAAIVEVAIAGVKAKALTIALVVMYKQYISKKCIGLNFQFLKSSDDFNETLKLFKKKKLFFSTGSIYKFKSSRS